MTTSISGYYKQLQRAYDKAVKEEKDVFVFEGRKYLTLYAKYLLEYLKTQLG